MSLQRVFGCIINWLAGIRVSSPRNRLPGRRAGSSRRGVAAIEFAFIAPVLALATIGLYDVTDAFITSKRVASAAAAIDEIATAVSATANNTNTISQADATTASGAVYGYLPELSGASPPPFGVILSSIVFTPTVVGCVSNCTYVAHVAWSGSFQGTIGTVRSCDGPSGQPGVTPAPDSADPSPTTLPTTLYSASPVLVADVSYTYQPLFASFIFNNIHYLANQIVFLRSEYLSPRTGTNAAWFQFTQPDSSVCCPGYC